MTKNNHTVSWNNIAQFRTWNEAALDIRDEAQRRIVSTVKRSLSGMNRAWTFERFEAPMIMPRDMLSNEYTSDDIWITDGRIADQEWVLRPETTPGTYDAIRRLHSIKPPQCFWQVGKSFRKEGLTRATRLRFFEFTQLEFQCLYSTDTKADYRSKVINDLIPVVANLCASKVRVIESDRLPSYSQSTLDIEVEHLSKWREVASISIRTDFDGLLNLEIAFGLDRIVAIHFDNMEVITDD